MVGLSPVGCKVWVSLSSGAAPPLRTPDRWPHVLDLRRCTLATAHMPSARTRVRPCNRGAWLFRLPVERAAGSHFWREPAAHGQWGDCPSGGPHQHGDEEPARAPVSMVTSEAEFANSSTRSVTFSMAMK
jgi:hypothetical protein